ncbi:hypothetical protein TCON_1457 [Astathelohania contejeani]|uniref:Uncharacterized protein n=1 Tax=Astathelohania contejeani TaxID=164912 RepID=A0ABQ7HYX1_9MICR|nr:hypothetical protein TCON_1457 [Thelohania contejeani]
MLQFLILGISFVIISLSVIKSREYKSDRIWYEGNAELERYYEMDKATAPQKLKQLVQCAIVVITRIVELEKEKVILDELYEERMISKQMWMSLNQDMKQLQVERMMIQAEADSILEGAGAKCMQEAEMFVAKMKRKPRHELKGKEDVLFNKKREMLTRELLRKSNLCSK